MNAAAAPVLRGWGNAASYGLVAVIAAGALRKRR